MGRMIYRGNVAHGAVRIGNNAGLVDAEVIVIGDKTYEWDNNASVVAGNVLVTIGATAPDSINNLKAAINANKPSIPVSMVNDPIDTAVGRVQADDSGAAGNLVFTTDMVDAINVIDGSGTLRDGENAGTQTMARGQYTVSAIDVSAGNILIPTGLQSPRTFGVEVYTSADVKKTIDSIVKIVGTDLVIDNNAGVDPALDDVIRYFVYE